MSLRVARRFVRRPVAYIVLAALIVVIGVAAYAMLQRPFAADPRAVDVRLDSAVAAATLHRDRIEARLRLQLLEGAMDQGRRSAALRPSYRLLEDVLERVAAGAEPAMGARIEAEMEALLADLSRDRASARRRIATLVSALSTPAGPGRQDDRP